MNTIVWFIALLLLGLAMGKLTGAGLAFTRGRTVNDLTAGVLGAVVTAVPLRALGLTGYSETLPTLLIGVGAAMLATWVTRIVSWPPEPVLRPETVSSDVSDARQGHDVMTTSDGTRLFISNGRLVVPAARELATEPVTTS
jgi:hypothetical protein